MAMNSIHCPVLGAYVTKVTDLEGNTTRIVCAEYDESDGNCRIRRTAREEGPLGQLLERMSEGAPASRGTMCILRGA